MTGYLYSLFNYVLVRTIIEFLAGSRERGIENLISSSTLLGGGGGKVTIVLEVGLFETDKLAVKYGKQL